jgi:hypothetical protein
MHIFPCAKQKALARRRKGFHLWRRPEALAAAMVLLNIEISYALSRNIEGECDIPRAL